MAHQLAALSFALVMATALLNCASFLLSSDGEKAVKGRLEDWYIYIEDGDWTRILVSSARQTEAFLNTALGGKSLSWRYFIVTSALGTLFLFWLGIVVLKWDVFAVFKHQTALVIFVVILNAALDTAALLCTRSVLRRASVSEGRSAVGYAFAVFGIAYFVVGIDAGINTAALDGANWSLFPTAFLMVFAYPYFATHWYAIPTDNYLALLPACFSALLLFGVLLCSWIISVMRPVIQPLLALLLQRLSEAPKGSVASVANSLLALTGVVTALKELLKK